MINRVAISVFCAVVLLATLVAAAASIAPAEAGYRAAFEKWKAELVEDRKANWIPLAGLFWLKPGTNKFGTGPSNAIVLPKGSGPFQAGEFDLQGENVTVRLAPGVQATIEGQPVTTAALASDSSGKATVLELGRLRIKVIRRGQRIGIRLKDLDSPALHQIASPTFYPLDMNYRVIATWVPATGNKTVHVPNVLGDVSTEIIPGEAVFTLNGQQVQLTALGGDMQNGLFFVFSDPTSKTATYPAGRFLESEPVKDGKLVIDFNKAYNPPCAFTPFATCPVAPKENRLTVPIPAGEKYDRARARHP